MHYYDVTGLIGRTKLQSRPYQHRIIDNTLRAYAPLPEQGGDPEWKGRGLRSVLIEAPTGSGKTPVALCAIRAMQDLHPDLEVGWISMRRNLLGQAEKENITKGIGARIHWLSMFDKTLPDCLLSTAKNKRMLVIDEAHHDPAASCASMHEACRAHYILGMTATTHRADAAKLCFDTTIKDAGIAALVRDGYLSPYHYYSLPVWGPKQAVECYLSDPDRWGQALFFFHLRTQAAEANALLCKAGITSAVVEGGGNKGDLVKKNRIIDHFREGKVHTVVNCLVLTEGFDSPDLQSVFLRPSCKGTTIQMAGRAFRKSERFKNKNIVQPAKGWNFMKHVLPEDQFVLEDGAMQDGRVVDWAWKSLKPNPRLNEIGCKMLATLARIDTRLPKFLTENQKRSKSSKPDHDHNAGPAYEGL